MVSFWYGRYFFFQIFLQKRPENIFCGIIVIWLIFFQKSFIDFFLSLQWCFSMISFWYGRFFSKTFLQITFSVSLWDGGIFLFKSLVTHYFSLIVFQDIFPVFYFLLSWCLYSATNTGIIPEWYQNDMQFSYKLKKEKKNKYSEISTEYYFQVISPNLLNTGSLSVQSSSSFSL